jgi:hypothetical protein
VEELRLERRGDVADLVEEDRAAVGKLEEPLLAVLGVGEGAPLVPEELRLEERLLERGAGHGEKGAARPGALLVDGFGHEPLAGSALAEEEDRRGVGLGHAADEVEHLQHPRALAHDRLSAFGWPGAPEDLHLAAEMVRLQGLLDDVDHLVHVEGLVDVVVGAELHGPHRGIHRGVGRDEDREELRQALADAREHLEPVDVGQPVVEEQQVVFLLLQELEPLGAGLGRVDEVALALQPLRERPADELLVLDDEDACSPHDPAKLARSRTPGKHCQATSRSGSETLELWAITPRFAGKHTRLEPRGERAEAGRVRQPATRAGSARRGGVGDLWHSPCDVFDRRRRVL